MQNGKLRFYQPKIDRKLAKIKNFAETRLKIFVKIAREIRFDFYQTNIEQTFFAKEVENSVENTLKFAKNVQQK